MFRGHIVAVPLYLRIIGAGNVGLEGDIGR